MKYRFRFLLGALCMAGLIPDGRAQCTIDQTFAYGWSANTGWTNWSPDPTQGASVGEYICQGYVYSANVGWISLGHGAPANAVHYQNNSATDWGVNYFPSSSPGIAILRGFAYGANIGWISFEAKGNPSLNLLTGQLYGYVYSANCGWINLGTNTSYVLKTNSIAPGIDTDGDGIADAWELTYFGNLTTATAVSSYAGDCVTDLQKYQGGTDPLVPGSTLRITTVAKATLSPLSLNLTFTSTTARVYRIETSATLLNPQWADSGLGTFLPDNGTTTTRSVSTAGTSQFFRVRALVLGP